jgi:hypothetical protein
MLGAAVIREIVCDVMLGRLANPPPVRGPSTSPKGGRWPVRDRVSYRDSESATPLTKRLGKQR